MEESTETVPITVDTSSTATMSSQTDGKIEDATQAMEAKHMKLESELRELKAFLSAMAEKQSELEARNAELEEPVALADEHRFALQRQPYDDDSSDSSDDDYTQFDHRRRQMERVFVRELKVLNKEKEMIKTIRALKNDKTSLIEKETVWEKERLEMERAKVQLQQELLRGKKGADDTGVDGKETMALTNGSETAALESEEIDTAIETAVPKLRYVEWSLFKKLRNDQEKDSFAVDVLVGEPVVSFEWAGYWGMSKKKRVRQADIKTAKSKAPISSKKKQPGQDPLPERIRIHSQHIIKILEKVSGESISAGQGDSIVMVRPFKFLVFYNEQIRHKYHKLKEMFGSDDNCDGHVVDAENPTATDKLPEGVESTEKNESMVVPEDAAEEEDDNDPDTTSATALQQLSCLVEFMDTEIQQKINYLESDSCYSVSFTDIWYLFKPGDEVIDQARKQAYRIIEITSVSHKAIPPWRNFYDKTSAKSDETPVRLHCVCVDFDGKNLGPVSTIFEISRFDGERAIASLDVFPLRYAAIEKKESIEAFRDGLISRGRMFLDVVGVKHMHYNGITLDLRDEIDSQVVIDFEEALSSTNTTEGWRPEVEEQIGKSISSEEEEQACSAECCREENIYDDKDIEKKRSRSYVDRLIPDDRIRYPSVAIYPRSVRNTRSPENALTEDELLIMSYRVFGFVLRSRKWAKLDLTYLSPISSSRDGSKTDGEMEGEKQETAFDQLVLPKGHKEMVLSLIAQHFRDKESGTADTEQADIVRGKGKGLIILLHGAPGVGKTTTAEGVAELFLKPLFQITCGDLGTTASEVEHALETNFSLANRWGCILLLDEADVFLTSRSPEDFIRNGLVAVFLRVLEYYAGVLFLTTNRIGDFDEAFASRVHISLHYPRLDLESTKDIFKLNLKLIRKRFQKKGRDIKIDDEAILNFAETYWMQNEKMRWNGRQIRNGCQTALALAEFDAQGGSYEHIKDALAEVVLQASHLEVVSRAYKDFISYLKDLYGLDSDRWAKSKGLRARENVKGSVNVSEKVTTGTVSSSLAAVHSPTPSMAAMPVASAPPPPLQPPTAQYAYPGAYYGVQYAQMPQPPPVPQPDATAFSMPVPSSQAGLGASPGYPYAAYQPGIQPSGVPYVPQGDQRQYQHQPQPQPQPQPQSQPQLQPQPQYQNQAQFQ